MSKRITLNLDQKTHARLEDAQLFYSRRYSLDKKVRKDEIGCEIFELGLEAFIDQHKLKV